MFDIRIGTILPAEKALDMIPLLAPLKFEGYELTCGAYFRTCDIRDYAARFADIAGGLPVSALGCYGNTLSDSGTVGDIERLIDSASRFGCRTVSLFAGALPGVSVPDSIPAFKKVFSGLCARAADHGVSLAIETGPEPAAVLRRFLDEVDSPGVGVNLDPANLVMVTNDDPVQAVHTLRGYIRHTHAKDGVHLKPCDPVRLYESFAENGVEAFDWGTCFKEVPLGTGQVDWPRYLAALEETGYDGYLTIEREVGENPAADIATAVTYLKQVMAG